MGTRRRTSRVRRNVVIVPKRKPPKLARGNAYVYFPFAEAPMGAISPEFRAALNDPRTRLRYDSRDEAEAATRELDRDYPNQRWHVTDAQRPRRNPAPPFTWKLTYEQTLAWAQRTFAPGTAVKFAGTESWAIGAVSHIRMSPLDRVYVLHDTRGTVVGVIGNDREKDVLVQIRLHDARSYFTGTQSETDLLHQTWDRLEKAGTDVVTISINPASVLFIIPLDDNWATDQQQSFAASKRRSSYKTRPNRMRRNPVPPPPYPVWSPYPVLHPDFLWWGEKTFAAGTRVIARTELNAWDDNGKRFRVSPGTPGTSLGTKDGWYHVEVEFFVLRDPMLVTATRHRVVASVHLASARNWIDSAFGVKVYPPRDFGWEAIEPIDDNWAASQQAAAASAKRRSSYKTRPNRLRRNTIPPPPSSWTHLPSWIKRTFADGTSVKLLHPVSAYSPRAHNLVVVPAGTKGRVGYVGDNVDEYGHKTHDMWVPEISVVLYPSYASYDDVLVTVPWAEAHDVLQPLDDNWAAAQQAAAGSVKQRYQLPASQRRSSYKTRPNRRTSRRR